METVPLLPDLGLKPTHRGTSGHRSTRLQGSHVSGRAAPQAAHSYPAHSPNIYRSPTKTLRSRPGRAHQLTSRQTFALRKENTWAGKASAGTAQRQRPWPCRASRSVSSAAALVAGRSSVSPLRPSPLRPSTVAVRPLPLPGPQHTLCRINFLPRLSVPRPDFLPAGRGHSLGGRGQYRAGSRHKDSLSGESPSPP